MTNESETMEIENKEDYELLFKGCESSHDRFIRSVHKVNDALRLSGYSKNEREILINSITHDLR